VAALAADGVCHRVSSDDQADDESVIRIRRNIVPSACRGINANEHRSLA